MRESARALEAYRAYERLGPARSIDKVAQELGKSRQLIGRWCTAHGWVERAAAYERRLAQEREDEDQEKRRKMREARIGVAVEMQRIGLSALRDKQPSDITAPAAVSIIHEAHETQRRDLGEPDQLVQVAGQIDLSVDVRSLSSVELDAYVGRLQAAIGAGGAGEASQDR